MKLKNFIHNQLVQFILALIIALYIKLVRVTSKTKYIDYHILEETKKNSKNIIFAFWHGRELMITSYLANQGQMFSVVTLHKDGNLAGLVLKLFNSKILRGSSTKGGQSVLRQILKEFKKPHHHLCITPDGPRGPRMKVSGATVDLSRLSGATILPVGFSVKKAKFVNSWDLFMLPKLFNHITIQIGNPISLSRDSTADEIQNTKQRLEDSLNNMTWGLDKSYGREKIKPGAIKEKNDKTV